MLRYALLRCHKDGRRCPELHKAAGPSQQLAGDIGRRHGGACDRDGSAHDVAHGLAVDGSCEAPCPRGGACAAAAHCFELIVRRVALPMLDGTFEGLL